VSAAACVFPPCYMGSMYMPVRSSYHGNGRITPDFFGRTCLPRNKQVARGGKCIEPAHRWWAGKMLFVVMIWKSALLSEVPDLKIVYKMAKSQVTKIELNCNAKSGFLIGNIVNGNPPGGVSCDQISEGNAGRLFRGGVIAELTDSAPGSERCAACPVLIPQDWLFRFSGVGLAAQCQHTCKPWHTCTCIHMHT